ncbi:MAG: peptidase S8 and S53 subtilisin kexin sedolisin [Chloroflexi bacterium]|nr:MAG: peptidase S8 and S53 subtilisin kexin sedolisin [Chloroflexota bacterium]
MGDSVRTVSTAQAISWDDHKSRTISRSITWNDKKTRPVGAALIVALGGVMWAGAANAALHHASHTVSVVVRAQSGQQGDAARSVHELGGTVVNRIGVINGLIASVPASAVPALATAPGVAAVTSNVPGHLDGTTYDATTDVNSLYTIEGMDGARTYWNAGFTGQGVDVAVIDSGVASVNGLNAPGKVVNGPDLSFESQNSSLRYLDTYGHGTHMAGIIAGRDSEVTSVSSSDSAHFMGVAPNAHIVSLKVADAHGQTDVSQMLAAIDWVVQHKNDNGLNIRVLNLSFGTDSTQSYDIDPLAFAAEQAWKHGIVVVVSAGNRGQDSATLDDPAIDPYVIAVGAADTQGSTAFSHHYPASFTSSGDGVRNPDLAAPGVHVASLRDPGSFIDTQFGGSATVASRYFRGSGTSQAAALVSGAAALVISQRPSITPDQLKALLTNTTHAIHGASNRIGGGELALAATLNATTPTTTQSFASSSGAGSLEQSRGSRHVLDQTGNPLAGEKDIFARAFGTCAIATAEQSATAWNGGTFNGSSWSGSSWSGSSWSGGTWSGSSWSGSSWSGSSWSSGTWSSGSWAGASWSSGTWSSGSWSGSSWSASTWS